MTTKRPTSAPTTGLSPAVTSTVSVNGLPATPLVPAGPTETWMVLSDPVRRRHATPHRRLAHEQVPVLADEHHRGDLRRVVAERDDLRAAAALDGGCGEGGAEVDAEPVAHGAQDPARRRRPGRSFSTITWPSTVIRPRSANRCSTRFTAGRVAPII